MWMTKSKTMRWAGHVGHIGRLEPEGKKQFGRPRRGWEDNIEIGFEVGCEGVDLIRLTKDRIRCRIFVSRKMNLRSPPPQKGEEFVDQLGNNQLHKNYFAPWS
jgi:hypothetical protein